MDLNFINTQDINSGLGENPERFIAGSENI